MSAITWEEVKSGIPPLTVREEEILSELAQLQGLREALIEKVCSDIQGREFTDTCEELDDCHAATMRLSHEFNASRYGWER